MGHNKKGFLSLTEFGRLAMAVAAIALAAVGADATAGISNTKHNLVSGNASNNSFAPTSGTAEICVFCHTPHAGAQGASVPLWNKTLPDGAGYQLYNTSYSSTIDGEVMTTVGSVSIACLSCHDGTQAMNNMINAPGSGNYNALGTDIAGNWTAGSGTASPVVPGTGAGSGVFAGRTDTTGVGNLGTDLRDDHPIGIQYCGGGPTVTAPGTACKDGDFVAPDSGTIGSSVVFWVETGGVGSGRQKTDMILYNRAFPVAGNGPAVECASCHDPHSETNATFLRISNASSAVCLSCHVK